MAKFITGKDLEDAICNIIWDAKVQLMIVSPFIKLDDFFVKHFQHHITNPNLHLLVVFGKNQYDKSKSLNINDFEFFKTFPKVSIIYVANLHAKYYGNETKGVITSINLYDHSFKNNIEFGVFSEVNIINTFTQSSDHDAWHKCIEIAQNGEPVFIRRPIFKKKMLSILGKDYISSSVLLDTTDTFFSSAGKQHTKDKLTDFADELDFEVQNETRPTRPANHENKAPAVSNVQKTGYCIRTGVQIPFNPAKPFCEESYKSWAQYKNPNYKEKYCHKTGNPSNGKTSMSNPILV